MRKLLPSLYWAQALIVAVPFSIGCIIETRAQQSPEAMPSDFQSAYNALLSEAKDREANTRIAYVALQRIFNNQKALWEQDEAQIKEMSDQLNAQRLYTAEALTGMLRRKEEAEAKLKISQDALAAALRELKDCPGKHPSKEEAPGFVVHPEITAPVDTPNKEQNHAK